MKRVTASWPELRRLALIVPYFTRDAIDIHIITAFNEYPDGIDTIFVSSYNLHTVWIYFKARYINSIKRRRKRNSQVRFANIYRGTIQIPAR